MKHVKNNKSLLKISSLCLSVATSILLSVSTLMAAPTTTANPSSNKISIDLVTVGDPGNFTSSKRHGAVPYVFCIGKINVTADQYCAFLNAVASTDTYGLYDEKMGTDPNIPALIKRSGISGSYTYSVVSDKKDAAIVYVSYLSAQRFCNWLENGQPSGFQKEGTTETGSYTLNGTMDTLFAANKDAQWRLPNRDEWFKAAYYKGNGIAAGYWHESHLIGAYGTYDMIGNVSQWHSGTKSFPTQKIYLNEDNNNHNYRNANYRSNKVGFRVVGPAPETSL